MGDQTMPSVIPRIMSGLSFCSGWGHHPRPHFTVETREGLEPWPSYQAQSPELSSCKQDMVIVTLLYKFGAEAST